MIPLLVISVVFSVAFLLGAWFASGGAYSEGFDAGFAAAHDDREVIPAEGSPFVRAEEGETVIRQAQSGMAEIVHADGRRVFIPANRWQQEES